MSRHSLIHEHMSLVKTVAQRMARKLPSHIVLDDLISAGMLGLIDAVDKYDPERMQRFPRYAEIRIKGAILDELRAMDHVSRGVRRQANELNRASRNVSASTGREATTEEVAAELGMSLERYHEHVEKLKPVFLVSLDDLTGSDDKRDASDLLGDPNAVDPSRLLQLKRLQETLDEVIEGLDEKYRSVVQLYYRDHMTLKEIGKVLGVSESRVSQVLSQAMKSLKKRVRGRISDADALSEILED